MINDPRGVWADRAGWEFAIQTPKAILQLFSDEIRTGMVTPALTFSSLVNGSLKFLDRFGSPNPRNSYAQVYREFEAYLMHRITFVWTSFMRYRPTQLSDFGHIRGRVKMAPAFPQRWVNIIRVTRLNSCSVRNLRATCIFDARFMG